MNKINDSSEFNNLYRNKLYENILSFYPDLIYDVDKNKVTREMYIIVAKKDHRYIPVHDDSWSFLSFFQSNIKSYVMKDGKCICDACIKN